MAKGRKSSKRRDVTEKLFQPGQVVKAVKESLGSIADAARLLGVARQTIYIYKTEFPEIAKAIDEARSSYKDNCQELARDNHLTALINGDTYATNYELSKMEPKPNSVNIDPTKLTDKELATLRMLLEKAKPDGIDESAI